MLYNKKEWDDFLQEQFDGWANEHPTQAKFVKSVERERLGEIKPIPLFNPNRISVQLHFHDGRPPLELFEFGVERINRNVG